MAQREAWFIGDEVTAAGFRLAGLRIRVPDPGGAERCFQDAQESASLIYLTPEVAGDLRHETMEAALRGADPLVLVVPDVNRRTALPDLPKHIRSILGLEA